MSFKDGITLSHFLQQVYPVNTVITVNRFLRISIMIECLVIYISYIPILYIFDFISGIDDAYSYIDSG